MLFFSKEKQKSLPNRRIFVHEITRDYTGVHSGFSSREIRQYRDCRSKLDNIRTYDVRFQGFETILALAFDTRFTGVKLVLSCE